MLLYVCCRRENDYEIVRYETVPAAPPISTQYM